MSAMSAPKLSFCMPTYNYGAYIGAAIESILSQIEAGIEIVVLDSGSTDRTRQIVEEMACRHPEVRYFWRAKRGGIDRDLASSVELAGGEYCWLLSADDSLQRGALRRMMGELGGGCDILLCNRIWCDEKLKPVKHESWLGNGSADRVVDLAQAAEVSRYLEDARSLGALFSFMSSIVFRREAWMQARADDSLLGSHYAHVQRLFSVGRQGGRLKYIAEPLVLCRGGADSFREGGLAERLLIDLRGFLRLSEELFQGDPALRTAFLAVLRREHPWKRWVRMRAETRDGAQWREVARLLRAAGYSQATIAVASVAGAALRLVLRNRK